MKLIEMKAIVQGEWLQKSADQELTNFESDTRKDLNGCAFFAFKGDNFDGHDYLQLATDKGAKLLIVSSSALEFPKDVAVLKVTDTIKAWQDVAAYKVKSTSAKRIGVTGSSGKTSTNAILAALLEWFYPNQVLSTLGNTNNHIGVAQNIMRLMGNEKVVTLEMGTNHPGEIAVLSKIVIPEVAILTTVGASHIGNFDDVNAILNEKVDLFRHMKKGGIAIVPIDLIEQVHATGALEDLKVLTFGELAEADFRVSEIKIGSAQSSFRLTGPNQESFTLSTNLSGVHQMRNISATVAALFALDLPLENCLSEVLPQLNLPGMRMRREGFEGIDFVLDCYNANPQSTLAFLDWSKSLFSDYSKGRVWVILGDMLELGKMSEKYHQEVHNHYESLFGTSENHQLVLVGAEYAKLKSKKATYLSSEEASHILEAKIKKGDTVLLKGSRGIRLETIYQNLISEK
jgi:UDP-N-acetylmuramoyl-tripeptide--D-alanyl-D-alanine ligase